jgi:hypothetical protein
VRPQPEGAPPPPPWMACSSPALDPRDAVASGASRRGLGPRPRGFPPEPHRLRQPPRSRLRRPSRLWISALRHPGPRRPAAGGYVYGSAGSRERPPAAPPRSRETPSRPRWPVRRARRHPARPPRPATRDRRSPMRCRWCRSIRVASVVPPGLDPHGSVVVEEQRGLRPLGAPHPASRGGYPATPPRPFRCRPSCSKLPSPAARARRRRPGREPRERRKHANGARGSRPRDASPVPVWPEPAPMSGRRSGPALHRARREPCLRCRPPDRGRSGSIPGASRAGAAPVSNLARRRPRLPQRRARRANLEQG